MRKARLLEVVHLPPPVHGASVVGQCVVGSKVVRDHFDVRVVPLRSGQLKDLGRLNMGKLSALAKVLWRIAFNLLYFRPDIVYFTPGLRGIALYRDFVCVLLIKLFRKPIVFHLHSKGIRSSEGKTILRFMYSFMFHKETVVLLSSFLTSDVAPFTRRTRVLFLSNGIVRNPALLELKRRRHRGAPIILFLSNLIESKGVGDLLFAALILRGRGLSFRLRFVGGATDDAVLAGYRAFISAQKLEEYVEFSGPKYDVERDQMLAEADIFAFPTYYARECVPLVILEAMQAGLAIVATAEGGIPEMIQDGETGFLVPRRDPAFLAGRLEILLRRPELCEEVGEQARRVFLERFTLERFERNLVMLLNSVEGDGEGSVE